MQPIVTTQSTVNFDRRDSALQQATSFVDLLKSLKIDDSKWYRSGLVEILTEVLPQIGADASAWNTDVSSDNAGGGVDEF